MKAKVLDALIEKLQSEFHAMIESARAAHEAATHEESKPEDQYDTRGLEASYLAGAQAKRAAEVEEVLGELRNLREKRSRASEGVQIGALVGLESEGRKSWVLVSAEAGGTAVEVDGKRVSVITPRGPLGEALLGRTPGDSVEIESQGKSREYEILSVD